MTFKKVWIGLRDEKTNKKLSINGYRMWCALYKCHIDVAFGQKESVVRFWSGAKDSDGFVHSNDEGEHFLWLKNRNHLSNLTHELFHLVTRISRNAGLSYDDDSEQQAYLIGWLFEEIRKLK